MIRQTRGYFLEAKLLNQVPTMEEYLPIALLTTGYDLLTNTCFVGMGDIATKEAFEWLLCNPKILKATTIICRLMDDIVSHKVSMLLCSLICKIDNYVMRSFLKERNI